MAQYKDIIFLLGAGASVEADIPASGEMIDKIEDLLRNDAEWKPYLRLYDHIKSSIYYSAGLKGLFQTDVPYNIETLVNTLYELERNEEHPLYPFIASWNSRFVALAQTDFLNVKQFRRLILRKLKSWMSPDEISRANYYRGLISLQRDINFPIQLFSLNYDLCVERLNAIDFRIETGFAGIGPEFPWDWERFEDADSGPPAPEAYLYKLHGSINWKRDESKNLYCVEQTESIPAESMQLIFGREFKLEAADPYLFYAYQLRKFSLQAKLIVSIGYGFGDEHVNEILAQALRREPTTRLYVVGSCENAECVDTKAQSVSASLGVNRDQVRVHEGKTKQFLEGTELKNLLVAQFASGDSVF
jgi:hypothetical protein